MPRKFRPLDRDAAPLRDASKIYIASEDTYAVSQYFRRFRTRTLQFVVLPTEDGRSAPQAVVQRLAEYKQKHATQPNDEFWVCIDLDHWGSEGHRASLHQAFAQCHTMGFQVVVSNPCFDLWMLLHYEIPPIAAMASASTIRARMMELHGGYNKTRCCGDLRITPDMVHSAMERSQGLDLTGGRGIPAGPTSQVYNILRRLIAREGISLYE